MSRYTNLAIIVLIVIFVLGQWNLTPLLTAEEGQLLETELPFPSFEDSRVGSVGSTTDLPESSMTETSDPSAELTRSSTNKEILSDFISDDEYAETSENCEPECIDNSPQTVDIGSLCDGTSPLIYCGRHLAFHFLLTGQKEALKPDKLVRVTVKHLALNCLLHVGAMEPEIWNSTLSKSAGTFRIFLII